MREFSNYPSPSSHPYRRRVRRARPHWQRNLAIAFAVSAAMIGIPILSLEIVGVWDERSAESETIRLADLDRLPELHVQAQQTELEALRDWLKAHFSDDEIEEMRDRFVDGRHPDEVRIELEELAAAAARGDFLDIPRYYTDRVKERLGEERTGHFRGHVDRIEPTSSELRKIAIDEVYPEM